MRMWSAKFAAPHLVNRNVVNLAGDLPQGHFDSAHASRLPRLPAELPDLAEQAIHVDRVFAQQAALEHQGVTWAGAVAHLTQPLDALVGVNPDDGAGHGRTRDYGNAQIGDLQPRGAGMGIDVLRC